MSHVRVCGRIATVSGRRRGYTYSTDTECQGQGSTKRVLWGAGVSGRPGIRKRRGGCRRRKRVGRVRVRQPLRRPQSPTTASLA